LQLVFIDGLCKYYNECKPVKKKVDNLNSGGVSKKEWLCKLFWLDYKKVENFPEKNIKITQEWPVIKINIENKFIDLSIIDENEIKKSDRLNCNPNAPLVMNKESHIKNNFTENSVLWQLGEVITSVQNTSSTKISKNTCPED